jgi:hypothetical protein
MRQKALNAFFERKFDDTVQLVKTDHEYRMRKVKEVLLSQGYRLKTTLLSICDTVLAGTNISEDQEVNLLEVRENLVMLDFDAQIISHINRIDRNRNPRVLKQRKEKAGLQQVTFFDPIAHFTLDEDVRTNMAEAERPQTMKARNWWETEHDKQIKNLEEAKQDGLSYFDSRLNLWVPQFKTLLELETNVFDWRPPSPDSDQESDQEED